MIYRYKKTMVVIALVIIVGFIWSIWYSKKIEYKIFGIIVAIIASVRYVFALFEYFTIEDDKITRVRRFETKKEVMYWKDVTIVTVLPYKLNKGIILRSNVLVSYDMVISYEVKGYRDIVRIAYERTKDNPDVFIDVRIKELLDKWNK
ncbi:hypothetical protein GCM10008908_28780 [Clostridium subterminale]|uniref:DUF304 domain-containing protein n=1 Tax=Clostridium subterminale TaxID=1550 RepID=A0ABP3W7S4_CLOSU